MTTRKYLFSAFTFLSLLLVVFATGCDKDNDDTPLAQTTYDLKVKDVLGITGKVTFYKNVNSTTVEIVLNGAPSGSHPAHIHYNSVLETGGIAISLNPVDGSGESTTLVTKLDNNTPISYEQLIEFDGYLNVHESVTNLSTILAQGDIGGNKLTGANKSYNLSQVDSSGVSGKVLFEKRRNNTSLVTITMDGTIPGEVHPARIHLGNINTVGGGPVVMELNSVNGTSGKSFTHVTNLVNGTTITYDNWIVYDGYLNILKSIGTPNVILSQGNIGS
jgi:hypothetical protein